LPNEVRITVHSFRSGTHNECYDAAASVQKNNLRSFFQLYYVYYSLVLILKFLTMVLWTCDRRLPRRSPGVT
jgi:hypothetical protein